MFTVKQGCIFVQNTAQPCKLFSLDTPWSPKVFFRFISVIHLDHPKFFFALFQWYTLITQSFFSLFFRDTPWSPKVSLIHLDTHWSLIHIDTLDTSFWNSFHLIHFDTLIHLDTLWSLDPWSLRFPWSHRSFKTCTCYYETWFTHELCYLRKD